MPATSVTTGWDVIVVVAMQNTSRSVSTVTDTAGNTYAQAESATGTGIKTEVWGCHSITGHGSNVITVTLTGSSLMSIAFEAYSSVSSFVGAGNDVGSHNIPTVEVPVQTAGNFAVGGLGFVIQAGMTISATAGCNLRQYANPGASSVGVALVDSASLAVCSIRESATISASKNWAAAGVELLSGGAATTYFDYEGVLPIQGNPTDQDQLILGNMPDSCQIPPATVSIKRSHGWSY